MDQYTTADELMAALRDALVAGAGNPVSDYALTLATTPKSILSKYTRCPKLKVESFSPTVPVWQGTIQFNGQSVPLSAVLDQLNQLKAK